MSDSDNDVPGFAEIDVLLDQALELDESARRDFLAKLSEKKRRIIESLLSRTDADELEAMAQKVPEVLTHIAASSDAQEGINAGRWQLKHQLGSGGMGQVFFALREEHGYTQRAAVKILWSHRIGSDFRARFFRERRILASLDHPGLARFLDGGLLADGRPWFAMEYVDGEDVISVAKTRSLRERLDLFQRICEALEFAHQRLIVHRDIKPQNVLIDKSGRARLLDFGVASILDDSDDGVHTRTGGSPITLQYASPEQVTGSLVAVGSDVYQLGLLLYEILTGELPYRLDGQSLQQAVQTICHESPLPPSAKARGIPQDLDAIVLCALRKEPSRRYRSVAMLADDIRRHVEGRPVSAQPASRWYVARRFVQRNALLVGVITLSALALSAATVISVKMAQEARSEAQRSRAAQRILADVFQQADPYGNTGADVTLADALLAAGPSIEEQLRDDPRLAWEVNRTLADIFSSLGLTQQEIEAYEAALTAARQLDGSSEYETLLAVAGVGNAMVRTDPGKAIEFFDQHVPDTPSKDLADPWLSAKYAQTSALIRLRMFDRADPMIRQMQEVVERFDVAAPRTRARLSQLLAGSARRAGDLDAADRHWHEAVEYMSRANKPDAYAIILSNWAIHLGRSGRHEESEAAFQQSLKVFTDHAPNDPSHGSVLRAYAGLLFRMARQAEAIDTLHDALTILHGSEQAYTRYVALVNLATYTFAVGRTGETIDSIEQGLSLALDEFGPESAVTGRIIEIFARVLFFSGEHAAGMALIQPLSDTSVDDPGDEWHLALAQGALDAGRLEHAGAVHLRVGDQATDDGKRLLLRLSCARGDRAAMKTLFEEIGRPPGTDYGADHLRIWTALSGVSLAVDAGEDARAAIDAAAAAYRDNQHVFLDVLDQSRALRALEQLALSTETPMPVDLRARLSELEQLQKRTGDLLRSDRATRSRSVLPDLAAPTGSERYAICGT